MGSIDRDLKKIYDAERDATRTPAGLLDAVARKAGRRRGSAIAGTAAAGLALVGLVATLGMTIARNAEPITNPNQPIEVRLAVDLIGFQNEGALGLTEYCGEAPPQAKPITEQFTLAANVDTLTDDLSTDVRFYTGGGFTTTNKSDILNLTTHVDAAGSIMEGWLFVQDGTVVGYIDRFVLSEDLPTGLRVWTDGGSTSLSANTAAAISCEAGLAPNHSDPYELTTSTILPAGEYEAYPVVQIDTSQHFDALRALAARGVSPSRVGEEGALAEPGSWDCRQAIESTGLTPIDCVEGLYDSASKAATVTVPPELQSPDIHVTLIGVPIPYSRTGEVVVREPEPFPIVEPDFDVCSSGQIEPYWEQVQSLVVDDFVSLTGSADIEPLLTEPSQAISVEVIGTPSGDGTLSDLGGFTVALTVKLGAQPVYYVGFARGTLNGGEPVVLDRYAGPTTVILSLTDLTWCGQPPPAGVEYWITFNGAATFTTAANGERDVSVVLAVTPRELPNL